MVTVFTPTYNRAYIIKKLYDSLCRQTCHDFEWLVVDDGSTDETEILLANLIKENKIPIRYIKQRNAGKHVAINRGVREAKGDLFFIVDSDDHLSEDAVEKLNYYYLQIADDNSFAGVSGVRVNFNDERIGGKLGFQVLDCSPLELRLKYHIQGDMAEAFKTSVLRKFPFPAFEGERFCPEALVWNRISRDYKLRFTDSKIYKCEYLRDGLTAKIARLRMHSPNASLLYYSELYKMQIPFSQKVKAAINFWRFAFCKKDGAFSNKVGQIGALSLFVLPIGYLFHIKDMRS